MRRTPLLAFGIAVVAPVILAACAGGGSGDTPSPTPTVAPIAIPTVTPTPAPTAEPTPSPTATPTPSTTPVLSPCEAVPDLPATVSDQPTLYSITVPDGWVTVTDEGAMGMQISRISLESPNFSVFVDEAAEGPFSPIYYETGAVLVIHVTTPSPPPYHFQELISESNVAIDGVNAPYHVFVEPSTWAGQLIDAHASQGGNDYLFYFGYNPETCPAGEELFQAMLDTLQFN